MSSSAVLRLGLRESGHTHLIANVVACQATTSEALAP